MQTAAKRLFRGHSNFHTVGGHGGIVPQAQSVFGIRGFGLRAAGGGLASPQGTCKQNSGIEMNIFHYLTV
jgi:hypothetical protein